LPLIDARIFELPPLCVDDVGVERNASAIADQGAERAEGRGSPLAKKYSLLWARRKVAAELLGKPASCNAIIFSSYQNGVAG